MTTQGHNSAAYGQEPQKRARERITHDFFGTWNSQTCGMTLEEKGAYAEIAGLIIGHGKPVPAEMVMRVLCVNIRKWRRLSLVLCRHGVIVVADGMVMVTALRGRLYKSGYSYVKDPIPQSLRWRVFIRDGYACRSCQSREDLTVDHVIAEINGGETIFENLQTLCRPCNSAKGGE